MENLSKSIATSFRENELVKKHIDSLFSDSITVLRQTKVNPDSGELLTKYRLITALAGSRDALGEIRSQLEAFLGTFGGSFEKEWELTELQTN